jgi:hypothetical protein
MVNLNSEQFERAAFSLVHAMDRFGQNNISHDVDRLERCVDQFRVSVDKLVSAMGMQAANDQRKVLGHSMAYDESAFSFL